jgi:hypothetical protein
VVESFRQGPPYAFFVPQEQRDPVAAVELLRRLAFNGIDIHQLDSAVSYEGQDYPAGTWVILMDQPSANFVRQLFAVQDYPDLREFPEGPPDQPYDVAGWTLPYQMDVRVIEAAVPVSDAVRASMSAVEGSARPWNDAVADASVFDSARGVGFDSNAVAAGIRPPAGRATGSGTSIAVDLAQNNAYRAVNRAWAQGGRVGFEAGSNGNSGRYVISGLSSADSLVSDLALQARRTQGRGSAVKQPRIGLYRPWAPSMDEGWTRWVLERYDFDFTNLYNADVRSGNLGERFDVIVIADMRTGHIVDGYPKGSIPARYAGGIGKEGVRALDRFVRGGGTLVTLNSSSMFAIDKLHLPVENVIAGKKRSDYFMSGSLVTMEVDASHPVMSGMPERSKVFVHQSPVFNVKEGFEGSVLAKYSEHGSPLLSGYLLGEEHLQGYAAALDVRHGEGRVVLLGMRPQWRGQPFGNFRILFNAALYSGDVAALTPANDDFWSPPEPREEEGGKAGSEGR